MLIILIAVVAFILLWVAVRLGGPASLNPTNILLMFLVAAVCFVLVTR